MSSSKSGPRRSSKQRSERTKSATPSASNYYIRIDNAAEVRRSILSTTKDLLEILTSYRRTLNVREQKLGLIHQLQEELSELKGMLDRARHMMPERSLDEVKPYLPENLTREQEEPATAPQSGEATNSEPGESEPGESEPGESEPGESKAVRSKTAASSNTEPARHAPAVDKLQSALSDIEERLNNL